MTGKQNYWISDPSGVYAQVEGADQRDYWTRVQGWTEASEPPPTAQVHVVHEGAGRGLLAYAAVSEGAFGGLGWSFASPPTPVDLTKDPQLVDQPPATAAPATQQDKPTTASASGGASTKEK